MTHIDAFANLVTPLKNRLSQEEWDFLISRGEILISQIVGSYVSNPIQQLNYTLMNKSMNIMKENIGKVPNEIPEVLTIWSAMDVIKSYIEKD